MNETEKVVKKGCPDYEGHRSCNVSIVIRLCCNLVDFACRDAIHRVSVIDSSRLCEFVLLNVHFI